MQTSIPLAFGDGEYVFALPIKQIVALESKAGPIDLIRHRLLDGGFGILDITETIRHGLIGGGKGSVNGIESKVSELKANALIEAYIDGKPLADVVMTAKAIIMALYLGYEAPGAQKKSPKRRQTRSRSTGDSSSTTASPSG